MYEYVSDSRRDKMLKIRRGKEGLLFGEGGEGFIGEDLWCYNCGDEGHLGDVRTKRVIIVHKALTFFTRRLQPGTQAAGISKGAFCIRSIQYTLRTLRRYDRTNIVALEKAEGMGDRRVLRRRVWILWTERRREARA